MLGYSKRCSDQTTRWDSSTGSCIPCGFKPGREITPNCGFDDDGGQHVPSTKVCESNRYNPGTFPYCQPCSLCRPGSRLLSPCNATMDTQCRFDELAETTQGPYNSPPMRTSGSSTAVLWAVPFGLSVTVLLAVLAFIYARRRNDANHLAPVVTYTTDTFCNYSSFPSPRPLGCSEPSDILCPRVLSAPLQTVLDELDVLEELVILLDPENQRKKSTKHLASLCSFPSTWITYTYSMKDSRSPLKAVLEGITSRHPDWTVGHLANMFQTMERHDAIKVLRNLDVKQQDV